MLAIIFHSLLNKKKLCERRTDDDDGDAAMSLWTHNLIFYEVSHFFASFLMFKFRVSLKGIHLVNNLGGF